MNRPFDWGTHFRFQPVDSAPHGAWQVTCYCHAPEVSSSGLSENMCKRRLSIDGPLDEDRELCFLRLCMWAVQMQVDFDMPATKAGHSANNPLLLKLLSYADISRFRGKVERAQLVHKKRNRR